MKTDATSIVKLASVANDLEAAAILGVLEEHGITARAVGGFTASFRAEAPGDVKILVNETDLARAQDLLSELECEQGEVDWSTVDVGDHSPVDDPPTVAEQDEHDRSDVHNEPRRFQFRIGTLLIIQTVICVLFALLQNVHAAAICAALTVGLMLLATIVGTVSISTRPQVVKKWLKIGLLAVIIVEAFPLITRLLRWLL